VPIVLKSGSINLLEPSDPVQACTGIALPLPLPKISQHLSRCVQRFTRVVISAKLISAEIRENLFNGCRVLACGQSGKVQQIPATSNTMLSHMHPLPVLIAYLPNKLILVAEPESTIPLVSKTLNSHKHWSLPSTSYPFIIVSYVPTHLLPTLPIRYFRVASSQKLCLYLLSRYLNNTSYGTPCTSAVRLRSFATFRKLRPQGGGGEFRSVCAWRQRLKVKVAERACPLTKRPRRNIYLHIPSCLVCMCCCNAR
jgi:hypothetical protein